MDTQTIKVTASPDVDSPDGATQFQVEGEWDLGVPLHDGALIAFGDGYAADHLDYAPYDVRFHEGIRPTGKAHVLDNKTSFSLAPQAYRKHIFNNFNADVPNHFSTALEASTTIEQSSTMSTTFEVSDSFEVQVGVKGEIFSADAKNTTTVSVTKSKSYTHSETKSIGSTDSLDTTLPPHTGEVVVLSALTGTLLVQTRVQTYWDGKVDIKKKTDKEWTTIDLTKYDKHLARPLDTDGRHNGLITITSTFGSAGETDQTASSIKSLSKNDIDTAVNGVLEGRAQSYSLSTYVGTVKIKRSLLERILNLF